ncbi:MAG: hypothetical protein EOP49_17705 [Sphingobacteriales bacterium]|nr:MAG: hypothetical protein EOP49_17705 [Sphingobacteriales bacterium]
MLAENFNTATKSGTFGGTLLVLLFQIQWSSLANTAVIAAVGAATSFFVSMGLRWIARCWLKRFKD